MQRYFTVWLCCYLVFLYWTLIILIILYYDIELTDHYKTLQTLIVPDFPFFVLTENDEGQ